MPIIELKYGTGSVPVDYDAGAFEVLGETLDRGGLSDSEIGDRLDHPIDSKTLEEIVNSGDTVLIVVPDATREVGCGQVVNLVVRRLIASGIAPHDMRIIFATGIHRKVTEAEKEAILTPFIVQRIKTLDHAPRDLMGIVRLGETSGGIPVELNRALTEHDHVILIGGVSFHYFAGFTGGRKLICPGLASTRTITATHKLAFDCEAMSRRKGVGTGLLDGNAVHEAFVEASSVIKPPFTVTTIVNDAGKITELYCGDWMTSHRSACDAYADAHTYTIGERRDLVIASCGGYPHDINLIQAHKALDAAAGACSDGGMIVLVAQCRDGLGRDDFIKWFDVSDSDELATRLCEKYEVNGQTAWSLLQKSERFDVRVVTEIGDEFLDALRLKRMGADEITDLCKGSRGYILPHGARSLIRTVGQIA